MTTSGGGGARPDLKHALIPLVRATFVVACLALLAALYHHGRLARDICAATYPAARAAAELRCEAFLRRGAGALEMLGRDCPTACE